MDASVCILVISYSAGIGMHLGFPFLMQMHSSCIRQTHMQRDVEIHSPGNASGCCIPRIIEISFLCYAIFRNNFSRHPTQHRQLAIASVSVSVSVAH